MKLLLTFLLCASSRFLFSQDCDCPSQLLYVIDYYEKNNPAFQKIKESATLHQVYLRDVQQVKADAKEEEDADMCITYLDRYVGLLKDHHSEIGFNLKRIDLSTPQLISAFKRSKEYLQYRKLPIDIAKTTSLLKERKADDIEGIYSNGTNIIFGIIKKDKSSDHFIGVVLENHKLLDVGHVLLELTRIKDNVYNVTYNIGLLGFNFKKISKIQEIENGLIPSFGFSKTHPTSSEKEYEFKALNDSTNYIRISSFDGMLANELDSFYNAADKDIRARPYLIIDIRNNGGGAEKCYVGLLPYAYTRPFQLDSALVWVSPDNIDRYIEASSETNEKLIKRMQAARPFSFISQTEDSRSTWALDSILAFPKKIALVYDRGTASSGEGLIAYLIQSDKVITVGENSGGYIGYGNVMTAKTPCEKYTMRSTTTKYFEKSKYEYVGIEPMYKVSKKVDWIAYAEKLLNKSK